MEASLRFYVDGLGFKMKHWWIPNREEDKPDGWIRWCWLELGEAAIMPTVFRSWCGIRVGWNQLPVSGRALPPGVEKVQPADLLPRTSALESYLAKPSAARAIRLFRYRTTASRTTH
jgi:hypothetical protein